MILLLYIMFAELLIYAMHCVKNVCVFSHLVFTARNVDKES